jgi:hypothetical protein
MGPTQAARKGVRVSHLLVLLGATALAACGGTSGAVIITDDGGGGNGAEGGGGPHFGDAGGHDAQSHDSGGGFDASQGHDAGSPGDDAGVDSGNPPDDGGGPTECPTGQSCISVPVGWQPYAMTTGQVCPGGYANPQSYVTNASAGDLTCTCTCSGTQACEAQATLTEYGATGCGGTSTNTFALDATPSCTNGGFTTITNRSYEVTAVANGASPACSATPSIVTSPPVNQTNELLCAPARACTSGVGSCLSPSEQQSLCIAQAGDLTCPAGYPTRTAVASSVVDTRQCGACGCGSTLSCTLQSVLIDNDNGCATTLPYWLQLPPSTCKDETEGAWVYGVQGTFASTGSGACSVVTSPSTATGGVTLDDFSRLTVCCR